MDRPSASSRTRNFLAAAVIGVALAGAGYVAGRDSVAIPPPPPPPEAPRTTPEPVAIPDPLLHRADLIKLAAEAADAVSGGRPLSDDMDGRRFIVRIPFGCGGPAADGADSLGWRYDADNQTLRIRVTLQDWASVPWLAQRLDQPKIEAVEGFWVPRPWTGSETCPAGGSVEGGERASSLGLAQFFAPDSSRVGQRRGRALEAVARVEPDDVPKERGLHLVLEGRIVRVAGGGTSVLCHAAKAYDRPVCLIAAEFARIAIENPVTQASIADWRL